MELEPNNNNNDNAERASTKKTKKRQSEPQNDNQRGKNKNRADANDDTPHVEFEDPFEDELEEEELVEDHNENEEGWELEGMKESDWQKLRMLEEEDEEQGEEVEVWRPDKGILPEGETLEFENSAYEMLHRMTVEWPCLSFDVVPDKLGNQRTRYPMTAYVVTASQGTTHAGNNLTAMKMSHMYKTKYDDQDSSDEEADGEDDHVDDDAEMEFKSVPHPAPVNRIRLMRGAEDTHIVSTWGADGVVYVWDVQQMLRSLDGPLSGASGVLPTAPVAKLTRHTDEGFAMDWCALKPGRLATGDCKGQVFLTELHSNGAWVQGDVPYTSHRQSVEDLQWSPKEVDVFASCSVDHTIKIWDARMRSNAALSFTAAECDVNVISWNSKVAFLMLSGADDGSFHIWDLRSLKPTSNACTSVGHFKWHSDSITSVEWDPNDESALAVAGADDQISVWDLSLERDTEAANNNNDDELPPQLLFCHQGQTDIKELHWHPQLPGVLISTAESGFNIFKPAIDVQEEDPEDIRV